MLLLQAEYYSDGLEGKEPVEHGADMLPPGALQHRAKERAQQGGHGVAEPTPDQPPAFFVPRSVAVKVHAKSIMTADGPYCRALLLDAGLHAEFCTLTTSATSAAVRVLPGNAWLGSVLHHAMQGGSGSSDAGSSPRLARRAPAAGSLFGAAFAGLARDRKLPARPPARSADNSQGAASAGAANGARDNSAAEPRRPGAQAGAGRAPPGFDGGQQAGGSDEGPPPGIRGRLGAAMPPGFDAPRSTSRHDDRVGGQPEAQRPPASGASQSGQDVGNDARSGWREARQPEPQRRHPAEGLRSAVRDAAGNVMGIGGGGTASSSRPAASAANGPALSPAAAAFAPGTPAARPDRQLYQAQLPKQTSTPPPPQQQQQQQDSPPPPPGLAQQHSELLPAADMSEDDTPAASDPQDSPAPQAMDSGPAAATSASSIGGAGSGSMDTDAAPPPHMNGSTATGEGPEAQQQAGNHTGSNVAKMSAAAATAPASQNDAEGATNVEVSPQLVQLYLNLY